MKLIFHRILLSLILEIDQQCFIKQTLSYFEKPILQRKKKAQKKHYLMQSWVLLLLFRSVVLHFTRENSSRIVVQFKKAMALVYTRKEDLNIFCNDSSKSMGKSFSKCFICMWDLSIWLSSPKKSFHKWFWCLSIVTFKGHTILLSAFSSVAV